MGSELADLAGGVDKMHRDLLKKPENFNPVYVIRKIANYWLRWRTAPDLCLHDGAGADISAGGRHRFQVPERVRRRRQRWHGHHPRCRLLGSDARLQSPFG